MNIYVGNLSFRLKEDHVRQLFEGFGEVVAVRVITDFNTGISKGVAFVTMKYTNEAKLAIQKLNKVDLDGKKINVSEAKDKPGTGQNNNKGGGGGHNRSGGGGHYRGGGGGGRRY